jgi:hypothetical protein
MTTATNVLQQIGARSRSSGLAREFYATEQLTDVA